MIKILLVDDDEEDFFITDECLLEIYPGRVALDWVKSYQAGLDHALEHSYDVCLIDHRLGQHSGLDLIGAIAEQRPELLTIMLTGTQNPELDRQALNLGAMDFVNKDEMTPRFMERVIRHARQRKSKELQLRWARKKAERAQLAMKKLLAYITHELRTPLIGIMGLADQLSESNPDESPEALIRSISSTAEGSLQMVNELLDFSKYEAGKIQLEETDFSIANLVQDIVVLLKPRAQSQKTQLKLEMQKNMPNVIGDPSRIRQVIMNLLSNAIKFTQDGQVTLTITYEPRTEDSILFSFKVVDTGIGIAPDRLDRIFEPFAQADKTIHRRFGGTGLGLAITRGIIELMNGHIEVKSKVGEGSQFAFLLPLKGSKQLEQPESAYPAFSHVTALVADDNPVSLQMAKRILEKFAVTTNTAKSGQEALNKVSQGKYDLVLLDINMPVLDGFETASLIRQRFPSRPYIVAQTAYASEDIYHQCMAAGMNQILTKPLGKKALLEVLQNLEQWSN